MRTITTLVLAAVTGLSGGLATDARAAVTADDQVPGKLLLMLDASGSMKAKDPSGLTKIEAAKKALTGVVGALPDTAQVGLRVYGATVDGKGKPTPAACADTRLVSPIGPLDKAGLTASIAAVKALGETPIAGSLTAAMTDLGATGKRNIVLVSDGEESCVPDPCPVVKKLTAAGIDLQIDTVGFGVNAKARTQLQCIANAGNGTYYDARNADQLTTSLSKLSQRALRPFTVSGVPVVGTSTADAGPEVAAGQYTDALTTGEGRRHYTLRRTIPGSTLRVAMTMRPAYSRAGDNDETVQMRVEGADGSCESAPANRIGTSDFQHLVTQTLRVAGASAGAPGASECATASTLTLSLERSKGAATPQPVEILVMEEPPVEDVESLPAPDEERDATAAPAPVGAKPVVGGVSFSSAPRITPGTWTETFVPGETIFYRVPVSWGQRLSLAVLPTPGSVTEDVRRLTHYNPVIYAPDRKVVGEVGLASGTFGADRPTSQVSREVRYRNREKVGVTSDLAGDHFLSIAVPYDPNGDTPSVPMTFSVTVSGTPSGEPAYAAAAPDTSTSPSTSQTPQVGPATPDADASAPNSSTGDGGSSILLWLGLGAAAVLGAGGAAYRIRRTRQDAQGRPPTSRVSG